MVNDVVFKIRDQALTDLKNLLEILKAFNDEVPLECTNDKITMKCMDPSHISMADINLSVSDFEEYNNQNDIAVQTVIPIGELQYALNDITKDSQATFTLHVDPQQSTLTAKVDKDKYVIKLLEWNKEETPTPKITLDSRVVVATDYLVKKLKKFEKKTDHIILETLEKTFKFYAPGEITNVETALNMGDPELYNIESLKDSRAVYSLNSLIPLMPKPALSGFVEVAFSKDFPCKIKLMPAGLRNSQIDFYLAPRIE